MDFTEFSLRYAIISSVAVVAAYMLVLLLRLLGIKRQRHAQDNQTRHDAGGIFSEETLTYGPYGPQGSHARMQAAPDLERDTTRPREQPAADFGEQLYRSGVEAELQQLRSEVAELKEIIAQLKAARRVSPQYNEAMLLAQRGMDELSIANQCGISIGEAELVLALSRNKQEYEDYDGKNHGRE